MLDYKVLLTLRPEPKDKLLRAMVRIRKDAFAYGVVVRTHKMGRFTKFHAENGWRYSMTFGVPNYDALYKFKKALSSESLILTSCVFQDI